MRINVEVDDLDWRWLSAYASIERITKKEALKRALRSFYAKIYEEDLFDKMAKLAREQAGEEE